MEHPIDISPQTLKTLSALCSLFDLQAAERGTNGVRQFVVQSAPLLPSDAKLPDYETAEYARASRTASGIARHMAEVTKAYLGLPNSLDAAALAEMQQDAAKTETLNIRDAFKFVFGSAPDIKSNAVIVGAPEPVGLVYHFFQLDALYDELLERYSRNLENDDSPNPAITSLSISGSPEQLGHAYAFYRAAQIREAFPRIINGADPVQTMRAARANPPTSYLRPRMKSQYN